MLLFAEMGSEAHRLYTVHLALLHPFAFPLPPVFTFWRPELPPDAHRTAEFGQLCTLRWKLGAVSFCASTDCTVWDSRLRILRLVRCLSLGPRNCAPGSGVVIGLGVFHQFHRGRVPFIPFRKIGNPQAPQALTLTGLRDRATCLGKLTAQIAGGFNGLGGTR